MKTKIRHALSKIIIIVLLIITTLFASSCFFDPDRAINLKDNVEKKIVVQEDSTIFYLYYHSEEHPIEDYGLIKVTIEYYVDYTTSMKTKDFFLSVPEDVQYEEGQPYFTVEIGDALTNESVVFISTHANYKKQNTSEDNSRVWQYILTVIIAIVMLILLWSGYTAMCDAVYSNKMPSALVWLGGAFIYVIVTIIIRINWGTGPASIIMWGGVFYFICTLFTYFKYKD